MIIIDLPFDNSLVVCGWMHAVHLRRELHDEIFQVLKNDWLDWLFESTLILVSKQSKSLLAAIYWNWNNIAVWFQGPQWRRWPTDLAPYRPRPAGYCFRRPDGADLGLPFGQECHHSQHQRRKHQHHVESGWKNPRRGQQRRSHLIHRRQKSQNNQRGTVQGVWNFKQEFHVFDLVYPERW